MSPVVDPQKSVLALLGDPATHRGHAVRRIDTHAASVFLAGERAFKIKRAVRFPFLDFSTLEKRKAACEAELEVNRAFAPQIYLGVVAITRAPNGVLMLEGARRAGRMGGRDAPLRRCAHARSPGGSGTHRRRARRPARAAIVAAVHAKAPPVEAGPGSRPGGLCRGARGEARARPPSCSRPPGCRPGRARAALLYARIRPLLVERGRRGLVRRVHGDLHLGNIALIEGGPVPVRRHRVRPADRRATCSTISPSCSWT